MYQGIQLRAMVVDIERDIGFPIRDDNRIEKLLIGTLLTLFGGFLVPLLPVYGYLLNVARSGMNGSEQLPEFTDWGSLFVDGLKGIGIVLIYQLPPLVITLFAVGAAVALGSQGEQLGLLGVIVFALGLLIAAVVWVLVSYLAIIAVLTFAAEGEVGAAFDSDLIRPVAFDTDFAILLLYGTGLVLALNILVGVVLFFLQFIALIPIVGLIVAVLALVFVGPLGAAASFYGQVVAFRVWGRGYAESRGMQPHVVPGRKAESAPRDRPSISDTSDSTKGDRMAGSDVEDDPTDRD